MPIVLTTTPPQPASKARMMFASDSVGGADASRNGFSKSMPVKRVESVVFMVVSPGSGGIITLFRPLPSALRPPPVLPCANAKNRPRGTDPGQGRHLPRRVHRRRQETDDRQAPAPDRRGREEGGAGALSAGALLRSVLLRRTEDALV